MAGALSGGYFPLYPQDDNLPDPEIRTFITNFYHTSDRPDANELWVSYFTKDAQVNIGPDGGHGEQEIREFRSRMWSTVQERKHTVTKVFPARFDAGGAADVELMLYGKVEYKTKDGSESGASWGAHAVLKKVLDGEREEWKLAQYRVWIQK